MQFDCLVANSMDEPTVNQPVEIDLTAQISLIILSVAQELDSTDSEALLNC